jgi:hypothetical protein
MEKEFVPYELALKLKQLGFDEPCFGYYQKSSVIGDNTILPISFVDKASNFNDYEYSKLGVPFYSVPTFSQAFRWFREKNDLVGIVKFGTNDFTYNIYNIDGIGLLTKESLNFNGTYEEAELACLNKLIEIAEKS